MKLGFKKLVKILDAHARMVFSVHSCNFVLVDMSHDIFKGIFKVRIKDSPENIAIDSKLIDKEE